MTDHEFSGEEDTYGLIMPFVVCSSKGGPFDDDAYVNGYEAGNFDAKLESGGLEMFETLVFHTANLPQIELIAMKHGYSMKAGPANPDDDPDNEWSIATFAKMSEL